MVASRHSAMEPEKLFLANLGLIGRITAFVCRRNHVSADEGEDFAAHVRLKLIEDDYAVLRKFEGRSTLLTYLTTVIHRLFLQYRVELWGKWRPSAEAKRLGDKGITLERMLTRDGYSFSEATAALTSSGWTSAEVEAIYVRLPHRSPRPVLVAESAVAENVASSDEADDAVLRAGRLQTARAAAAAIDTAISAMATEDQVILKMRFWSARRVSDIASALGIDQKKLYKRIERLLSILRTRLQAAGVAAADIEELIAHGDHDIVFHSILREKSENSRSHSSDGEVQMKSGADETSDAAF